MAALGTDDAGPEVAGGARFTGIFQSRGCTLRGIVGFTIRASQSID